MFLNTRVAPFNDVRVRRAVNYAIDRARVVRLYGIPGTPTCQVLPPNLPGYRPYCPYTARPTQSADRWRRPDMEKARRLIAASHTAGTHITIRATPDWGAAGPYIASLFNSLGYHASFRVVSYTATPDYVSLVSDSSTHAQIGAYNWFADYPVASDFLNTLLSCGAFQPRSAANLNLAEFCDPSINRQINQALSLQTQQPTTATTLWQKIDKDVADAAPWVPLFNSSAVEFISTRLQTTSCTHSFPRCSIRCGSNSSGISSPLGVITSSPTSHLARPPPRPFDPQGRHQPFLMERLCSCRDAPTLAAIARRGPVT